MNKLSFIIICLTAVLASCRHDSHDAVTEVDQSMSIASDLSNQRVTAFAEDSVGRIWIGTFRGLNRYNGQNYHQYFCTDSIIDLPDNQIASLFNDSHNRLWVGTINGVAFYNNNNHFQRVNIPVNDSKHANQIIESKGRDPQIYVNFNTRLDVYDEDNNELRTVLPNFNNEGAYSINCHFDRRNKLWVVTNRSIRCYQPDDFQLVDSVPIFGNVNTHYMDVDNDCMWLGGERFLSVYDLRKHEMRPLPHQLANNPLVTQANIINIHPYEGGYWLLNTSNKGLIVYNSISDKVWAEGDTGYPFDLPRYRITGFYTDSFKNLWVGSYDHGCTVINKYQRQFNSRNALHTFVNERAVIAVDCDTDGNLWMSAGYDGILVYNINTGEAHTIDPHQLSGVNATNASVSAVKIASDGQLWIASLMENKVWRARWDGARLNIIREYMLPLPLSFVEDSQGAIWVGTGSQWLVRYNKLTDSFDGAPVSDAVPNTFISGIAPTSDNIYVGAFNLPLMQARWSDNMVAVDTVGIDGLSKVITRSTLIPTDMLYDSYGLLWIGTVGNGLLQYDPEHGTVTRVADIPCTDISAIEEDRQGHVWISTQYGLARYDRTTGRIKCYYANDGIGGNQFYDRASTIFPDGTLVFAGTHGVTEFNPINVGYKRKVPLVFEDLKIHNAIVDPLAAPDIMAKNLAHGQKVTLGPDENAFSISFSALDYASDEPPSYSYRLEGHDPYWIDAQHNNEAYYAKLKPGNYTFRVRIADGSNSLVESEIALPIHISGNAWLSWWAISLYVLVAVGILALLYLRRRKAHQEHERMKQMLKAMERVDANAPTAEAQSAEASEEMEPSADGEGIPVMSEADVKFMQDLQALMETELANPDIDVNRLAEMMHISRTKFYYKVKAITGENPSVFFKTYKLNRAAQLLKEGRHTVSEVAYKTGFSTVAHFSTSFKKQFGKSPTYFSH